MNKNLPLIRSSVPHYAEIDYSIDAPKEAMQKDRELFAQVESGKYDLALRFYRWAEVAVSYGRTQGIAPEIADAYQQRGIVTVERPTGGGIVEHNNDLCFALAWRKTVSAIPWKVAESYPMIHGWIQESLKDLGWDTEPWAPKEKCTEEPVRGNSWCFQQPVCADLMRADQKIVGGAQWRTRQAALHQGSIAVPLSDSFLEVLRKNFRHRVVGV